METNLKYFQSVSKDNLGEGIENVLQQEHGRDGQHPRATQSNDGFMTAEDKRKLDLLFDWVQKQVSKNG